MSCLTDGPLRHPGPLAPGFAFYVQAVSPACGPVIVRKLSRTARDQSITNFSGESRICEYWLQSQLHTLNRLINRRYKLIAPSLRWQKPI